jgi:hypothetical protein
VESLSAKHDDGTIDSLQRAGAGTDLDPAQLERLYWDEIRRVTRGVARYSRGAIRVAGIGPALLRFGPRVDGGRPIVGGLFARRPGGRIAWQAGEGETAVVVEGFAPLLAGPLWRLETRLHQAVGRRFLARVARESD